MLSRIQNFAAILSCLALASCGGGGGGSTAQSSTGYFIDAPVAGLTYTNGSTTGTTGADGSFTYTPGTAVTFKVGNVTVGSITNMPSDNKITPYDVVGVARTDTTNANAAVIAQFLQSIATSSGGTLSIPTSVSTALAGVSATSLVSSGAPISSGTLSTLVSTATGGTGTVVPANTALTAMNTYIANNNIDTSIRSNAAEGVWTGSSTATNNAGTATYQLDVLVLENGQFYTMFGVTSGNNLIVYGGDMGTASLSGSSISGSVLEIVAGSSPVAGTLSATVVKGTSLSGTASYPGVGSASFSLTPLTGSYNYNTAASISTIQGSWTGFLLDNASASITIGSNGAITGTSTGCSFTGTATPRASGKNVFDLSLTFGASPCVLPGQTATGIGLVYTTTSNKTQLVSSVFNSAKTAGTMFFAQR
jgi:hypothetical protein